MLIFGSLCSFKNFSWIFTAEVSVAHQKRCEVDHKSCSILDLNMRQFHVNNCLDDFCPTKFFTITGKWSSKSQVFPITREWSESKKIPRINFFVEWLTFIWVCFSTIHTGAENIWMEKIYFLCNFKQSNNWHTKQKKTCHSTANNMDHWQCRYMHQHMKNFWPKVWSATVY